MAGRWNFECLAEVRKGLPGVVVEYQSWMVVEGVAGQNLTDTYNI